LVAASLATVAVHARGDARGKTVLFPSDIFQRSLDTMATIRAVHSSGHYTEREVEFGDPKSTGSWRVQGDCIRQGSTTVSRFSDQGNQTGRHPRAVDEEFIVRVPGYAPNPSRWWPHWTVWVRTLHPSGRWHRTAVTHDAEIASSLCPSLIVPGLRLHLPGPIVDLGRVRIDGRSTIHLQSSFEGQGGGATDDFYVDPATFRWIRVRLSGWGAGCCHAFSGTFDFSRYNIATRIYLPAAHGRWQQDLVEAASAAVIEQ
jgi:hypothetical protein